MPYQFYNPHPKGTYILRMPHHWVACVDRVLYDTWDCRRTGVSKAWKIG